MPMYFTWGTPGGTAFTHLSITPREAVVDGSIRAAEANLATASNSTIVIPGHGPVGGKSEMTGFRDMLVTIRENVAALKKQGRSLNETIAAKPTAAYDAKWGQFLITPAMFTALVYQGVRIDAGGAQN
jgi:hypothetical protein